MNTGLSAVFQPNIDRRPIYLQPRSNASAASGSGSSSRIGSGARKSRISRKRRQKKTRTTKATKGVKLAKRVWSRKVKTSTTSVGHRRKNQCVQKKRKRTPRISKVLFWIVLCLNMPKRCRKGSSVTAGASEVVASRVNRGELTPDSFPANRRLCWKSELAYFDNYPLSQTCIESSEYLRFDPVTSVTDSSTTYDFVLYPAQEYVYDTANIRVGLELKIVKNPGDTPVKQYSKTGPPPGNADLTAAHYDPVALINCPLTSLFNQIEITLNDVPINSNCTEHMYRAFMECSFNYRYVDR